jgi:branched-chain amino acid aminotransferase
VIEVSECIKDYFICNGEVKKCSEFNETYIKDGESIYEVIRIIDREPLFLHEHLQRLQNSVNLSEHELKFSIQDITEGIYKLIDINKVEVGNIKLILNLRKDENVLILYFIQHHYPAKEQYENGVKTILFYGERKNPNAKVINNNFRQAVNKEIKENNAYEAILVDNSDIITEGSRSNIFMVKDSKVFTAPLKDVLPGITRCMIIKLLQDIGIEFLETSIRADEINTLDGLFISGTSPKVLPISKVNQFQFNSSENKIIKTIMKAFDEEIERDIHFKVRK